MAMIIIKTVEVVGSGECADCALTNIKPSKAFSGLRVTIDCKSENGNGEFKTRRAGELDVDGKFKASLPEEIVENGKLKEECYALLHSASGTPCPAYDGLESSKLVLKEKSNEKHTFGLAKCHAPLAMHHLKKKKGSQTWQFSKATASCMLHHFSCLLHLFAWHKHVPPICFKRWLYI
ncbi:hypothetical protein KPL71_023016 [Citrus sinensis]|uniref:Uncharacterized protein n=1 Tax=Citrus sinensis TaxID=2711 RepID=A0ACB8IFW2_CITSI|nr:hypothetical protein KPL71_023016 [Citrus sinensis]